jgi:hypothetical protein
MEAPFTFATLWVPSLNLLGAPTIFALTIGLAAILLTEKWRQFDFKLIRAVLIVIAPPVLFGFVVHSKVAIGIFHLFSLSFAWQCRAFPNADDICPNYIYLVFALIISLRVWQLPSAPFRILGTMEALFLGSAIIIEIVGFWPHVYEN